MESLEQVFAQEHDPQAKAHLLTKIAGNLKKAESEEKCIQAGLEAHSLLCGVLGPKDLQSCRALVNLAGIYAHFGVNELALQTLT